MKVALRFSPRFISLVLFLSFSASFLPLQAAARCLLRETSALCQEIPAGTPEAEKDGAVAQLSRQSTLLKKKRLKALPQSFNFRQQRFNKDHILYQPEAKSAATPGTAVDPGIKPPYFYPYIFRLSPF